ncbi:MAG TPA: PD-(D/E)XK nuclease family protein, partial [Solirubrobacteraceae bacterium]|nr:PD-(D/E)XK nuclease family protein [Solirubrobacteraceae bacterium]
MTTLDIPRVLPVDHLSVSSVNAYLRCPLKWRKRYIDREYEPPSGSMILGSAVGAAEAQADQQQIDAGDRLSTSEVLDAFSDEWDDRSTREEVDWNGEKPDALKDSGVAVVTAYERTVAPRLQPVSAEREFTLQLPGVDWTFTGYFDLEEADGGIVDRKVKAKRLNPAEALVDLQPTSYLLARRAEGNPAPEFRYHTLVRTKTPAVDVIPARRTDVQLDAFVDRLYGIAAEINWRLETGVWGGA